MCSSRGSFSFESARLRQPRSSFSACAFKEFWEQGPSLVALCGCSARFTTPCQVALRPLSARVRVVCETQMGARAKASQASVGIFYLQVPVIASPIASPAQEYRGAGETKPRGKLVLENKRYVVLVTLARLLLVPGSLHPASHRVS